MGLKENGVKRLLFFAVVLGWFLSHIPFLSADADIHIRTGGSRGSWSDEGLYTSQVRNYINHGLFDLLESDAVLKTPLLSAYLYLPFIGFGTSLEVARVATVTFLLISMFIFARRRELYSAGSILILTTFLFYPIHQYSHIGMAEIYGTLLLLNASMFFSVYINDQRRSFLYYTYLSLFLAVLFKIQFIYVLVIPVLSTLLSTLLNGRRNLGKEVLASITILILLILVMIFLWYLPFQNEWASIVDQQSGIFTRTTISVNSLLENIQRNFLVRGYLPFTSSFLIGLLWSIRNLVKNRYGKHTRGMVIFSIIWFFVELHKLPMDYLPVRYLISLYFSMGLLISIVTADILISNNTRPARLIAGLTLLALLIVNSYHYRRSFTNRAYSIANINEYISFCTTPEDVLIGTWATSFNWKSKNFAIPVWHEFLWTDNPIGDLKPRVVVSEPDERESDFAYKQRVIDLTKLSDSTRQFRLAYWNINLYWIPKNEKDR